MRLDAVFLDFFKHGQLDSIVRYNGIRRDAIWEDLRSFALMLKALHAAMARRLVQASARGSSTPFSDPDVLATLESISCRFSEALYKVAA